MVHFAIEELHKPNDRPLLPCHPKDLIGIAMDKAEYLGAPARLTEELLSWAWDTYFVSLEIEAGMKRSDAQQGVRNG